MAMLKCTSFLLIAFLVSKARGDDLCSNGLTTKNWGCCAKEFEEFCCSFVSKCDDSTTNNTNVATNSSTSTARPECSLPFSTTACLAGFYKGSSDGVLPCPDGFYCPAGTTCLLPCSAGSICLKTELLTPTNANITLTVPQCNDLVSSPVFIDGLWTCPGCGTPKTCDAGYYCPNTSAKYACPEGHFCRLASIRPKKCPLSEYCSQGSSASAFITAVPVRAGIILLLMVAIYYGYKYRAFFLRYCKWCARETERKSLHSALGQIVLTVCQTKPILIQAAKNKTKVNIKFRDVRFKLNTGTRTGDLLNGVNGTLDSNKITAIMGPSGGGKTTLLNILSARASYGKLSGEFEINKKSFKDMRALKSLIGVVPQDDIMHEQLTPREVLTYQARLRLSSSVSMEKIKEKVDIVLDLLELKPVGDTVIGSVEERVLSGGQRKRVNIGMELVVDPCVLLLDEPTSGLDSSSSLAVLKALHFLAEKTNLTIATVIHQPRYEIFSMLHNIILLSSSGKTIYQGSPDEMLSYFKKQGFVPPTEVNPADFILDVITGVSWHPEASPSAPRAPSFFSKSTILAPWNLMPRKDAESEKPEETCPEDATNFNRKKNFFYQFWAFLIREFLLQRRNLFTVLMNYVLTVIGGSIVGAIYQEVPLTKLLLMATMSSLMMGLTGSLISLRCFNSYPSVFMREASSGINLLSYYLAVNIAQLPHLVLLPLFYLSLNYLLIFPRASFQDWYLIAFATYLNVSGLAYIISISCSPKNGQMACVVIILISSMLAGTTPTLCDLNAIPYVGPAMYSLSFSKWFAEASFEKEVEGLPLAMEWTVNYYRNMNDYSLDNFNNAILFLVLSGFVYRILALLALFIVSRKSL